MLDRSVSRDAPFSYIWPQRAGEAEAGAAEGHAALEWESAFVIGSNNVRSEEYTVHPDGFVTDHEVLDEILGFRLGHDVFCERDVKRGISPSPRESMGVIVGRRMAGGQVWVVLGGNTGPATEGLVIAMQRIPKLITASIGSNSGDGFWAVVKTTVNENESITIGENREIARVDLVHGPTPF